MPAPPEPDDATPALDRAWGIGLATIVDEGPGAGDVLDAWFPHPALGHRPDDAVPPAGLEALVGKHPERRVRTEIVSSDIELAHPPQDTVDVYLRLHLLSHRLVRPHGQSLEGVFGLLTNVVWTSAGPCPVEGFEEIRAALRGRGALQVTSIDKFPRMTDYVIPPGVRIGDADRVRLGAHLAEGTTVMHEGFVNYNAGTLGHSMIEGRISAGVVIGDGSDVGGGASTMGTLSGGGKQVITIGRRCLVGAEAGVGIPLGDDCVVEAGLYLTAGTKVTVLLSEGETKVVKALELAGADNVLFRRNSVTGAVEAVPRQGEGIALNAMLHDN